MVLSPADIVQLTNALKPQFDTLGNKVDNVLKTLEIMETKQHNSRLAPSDKPKSLPLPTGVPQAPEQPTCLAQIMVSCINPGV